MLSYLSQRLSSLNSYRIFRSVAMCATLLLSALIVSCSDSNSPENAYQRLTGFTMGTTYHITLRASSKKAEHLKLAIDQRLQAVNQLMSTYIDDSELSQFNHQSSTKCQPISNETLSVVKAAIEISEKTQGRFDVTLDPLIAEWGFDKKQTNNRIPSDNKIQSLLTQVGSQKIRLGTNCIAKEIPSLSINLSAIAKGYGVDEIARLIEGYQVADYLVEIGGETASKGLNPRNQHWTLAVESPLQLQRIQKIFTPNELGVATSGDYRNYFEKNGERYSHTIDPTTGRPIHHSLASVTVLHKQTMLADAYATAFMVMGCKQSLVLANELGLPIFMLVKSDKGFKEVYNELFASHLLES